MNRLKTPASCSKENGVKAPNPKSNADIAYLSIKVAPSLQSRAAGSGENEGLSDEREIKSLYLITFNDAGGIVGVPGGTFYSKLDLSSLTTQPDVMQKTDAVKVSSAAKNLVVIANAGAKLLEALNALTGTSTFTSFNAAIRDADISDITGANGFTMIMGGDETNKTPMAVDGTATDANRILYPYVDIDGKIKEVTGTGNAAEDAAKALAEANRVPVKLERLASKLIVKERPAGEGGVTTDEEDADFVLESWTVDAVNSTYFPFAEKTLIAATHNAGDYINNFYTKDPNFTNNTGIVYAKIDAANNGWSYQPQLPDGYAWKTADANQIAYVIENTMDANEQKIGNATRIVLKAKYTPKDFTVGADWFYFNGLYYKTLIDLQAAYAHADAPQSLKDACVAFYDKIEEYYDNTGKPGFAATKFEDLTADELAGVDDGGQVVKNGTEPVIRWYQGGLCYYDYEIRHDNDPDAATSAFAKYGTVRNNWYNLKLNTVSGPGSSWYPEIDKPGPGDPKPEDPIDTKAGYLGISVEIAKWIIWETGFDI